ncbi:MAG: lysophospholipid acyltransferase family protein [Geminicoccaceae bacterium]
MQPARSALFMVFLFFWTSLLAVIGYPYLLVGDAAGTRAYARFWERGVRLALATLVGLRVEIRGQVPTEPALIAAKHQSALETLVFHILLKDISIPLKQELTRIPLFGRYLVRADNIVIDRGAGASAIKKLVADARAALASGLSVLIFPEGTRTQPGGAASYKPGIAALYNQLDASVVPVALNTGVFWQSGLFGKKPGTAVIEFLDPIAPGMDRRSFMKQLQDRIETATHRLVEEAES